MVKFEKCDDCPAVYVCNHDVNVRDKMDCVSFLVALDQYITENRNASTSTNSDYAKCSDEIEHACRTLAYPSATIVSILKRHFS